MVHRRTLIILAVCLLFLNCKKEESQAQVNSKSEKMAGASFVASRNPIALDRVQPLVDIHCNWVTYMPFALGYWDSTALGYNDPRQWYGETEDGITESVNHANSLGLKVMIKPQVWYWGGNYTGHFHLNSEAEWREFEKNYSDYILLFARLSEKLKVPLFCIGTEYANFIKERPDFWGKLITDIRSVYSGQLVYAANWDNYQNIPFWDKLDYIGVDAYFPVSELKTPSKEDCIKGWTEPKEKMKALSRLKNKKVIFTEYGYSSIDFCAKESWNPPQSGEVNMQAQVEAYKGLYEAVWDEDWFAGGFFWKWFHNHETAGGENHRAFTPQNKPVIEVISNQHK